MLRWVNYSRDIQIEGLKVITPAVFVDERGYFMETYNYNDYKAAGIDQVFVQDNQSASSKGVLRGLHFNQCYPRIMRWYAPERERSADVAVDLRSSPTLKVVHVLLTEENKKFLPKIFARFSCTFYNYAGFLTMHGLHPNDEGGLT